MIGAMLQPTLSQREIVRNVFELSEALEILFHQITKLYPPSVDCVLPTEKYILPQNQQVVRRGLRHPSTQILQDLQVVSSVEMPEGVVAALMT